MKAVQFVTLLLFSLVTGVFRGTWFSLSRSIASTLSTSEPATIRNHQVSEVTGTGRRGLGRRDS